MNLLIVTLFIATLTQGANNDALGNRWGGKEVNRKLSRLEASVPDKDSVAEDSIGTVQTRVMDNEERTVKDMTERLTERSHGTTVTTPGENGTRWDWLPQGFKCCSDHGTPAQSTIGLRSLKYAGKRSLQSIYQKERGKTYGLTDYERVNGRKYEMIRNELTVERHRVRLEF
ncbi:hypothetical protein K438DRAFT_1767345 [Mycena galopus ATCC 62051]|nr:hypothetical protein K438DRAFT_1767345 [Mycena galopus ATCC 62051]